MNLIFLDIDGVLNSSDYALKVAGTWSKDSNQIDPDACARLQTFCDEVDAKIVISSSWRKIWRINELRGFLFRRGLTAQILDITPTLHNKMRGDEVNEWLRENGTHPHVIFDDDGDFHSDQPLVLTSWDTGLQDEHIEQARKFFK